ncbi:N-6 DNA methylase [bacterium]|nr:N-6 DNA methylase [bacterium]
MLSEEEIKKKVQVFTPEYYASIMAHLLITEPKQDIKILDNSCGTGILLIVTSRIIINFLKSQAYQDSEISAFLEKSIYGFDVDAEMVKTTKKNLNNLLKDYKLPKVNWDIQIKDFLSEKAKSYYDYIISNPPYIEYRNLSDNQRQFLSTSFTSCSFGKFDYYYAFIEHSLNWLSDRGRMVFLVPNNVFKTISGEPLRELMKPSVEKIIDFCSTKVFKTNQVQTSSAIISFQKNNLNDSILYSTSFEGEETAINKSTLFGKWLFKEINKTGVPFGSLFEVHQSIATLRNSVFIHKNKPDIEEDLLYQATSPKDENTKTKRYIIIPYIRTKKDKIKRFEENLFKKKYPKAYFFLFASKNTLTESDKDKGSNWFEFGRSQGLTNLWKEKLMLSPIVSATVKVYKLNSEIIPYSGIVITRKNGSSKPLSYAIEILSSDSFHEYCQRVGVNINGRSIRVTTNDIKNFLVKK